MRQMLIGVMLTGCGGISTFAAEPVDYVKQIKPLLADHCTACHGPNLAESGLRLDAGNLAIRGGDRGPAIVPGKSTESLLHQVLIGAGDVSEMPMDGESLTAAEIDLVKRWIDEGAKFPAAETITNSAANSDHWVFQPIRRPAAPELGTAAWVRTPIDAFILDRLRREGLQPSASADRQTLIRRLSLDLRGLPPTWDEVEEFLTDNAPDAYERLVDRMLASPQYGERWGRHWLDLARYADSHGFTIDGPREIWLYRDWVIDALNADMPFDRFTIEQLAGDLLPAATTSQMVATGFHRNTLVNQEGGTDREQFRVEAVSDRVDTTGSVWLGLTVACARCHQHKYDPISQRDYYELFAVFNNQDEPTLPVPTAEQQTEKARLTREIAAARKPLEAHDAEYLQGLPAWERQLTSGSSSMASWQPLVPAECSTTQGSTLAPQENHAVFVDFSGPDKDTFVIAANSPLTTITAIRLEALTHASLPNKGPGRADNGNFVLNEFEVYLESPKSMEPRRVPLGDAIADHAQDSYSATDAIDGDADKTGWAINIRGGSLNVDREAVFFPDAPIGVGPSDRLVVKLVQNHGDRYVIGHFRLSVSEADPALLKVPAAIRQILAKPASKRSQAERDQLLAVYRQTDSKRKPLADKVAALQRRLEDLNKAVPTTLVMRERADPRETHIHIRGDFLRHGDRVQPGVPDVLPPLDAKRPTRLDFARWLVDGKHPLTARVTVNRVWQRYFGLGLVETENDFGTQGSPPSHPELLDWLADEFMQSDWSLKRLHRLIVTSAVYRQSSQVDDRLLERDPRNRLLARQSRIRLEAEAVRDVALAASGLLYPKLKGPGVHPPQPDGIYVLTQQKKPWPEEQGPDRYRRAMYTYFWRSSPYPMLVTFDATDGTVACTRRNRSNTPLQSLTLANDQAFHEMAQGLAAEILVKAPPYLESRAKYAFRAALSRDPSPQELAVLSNFVVEQEQHFAKNAEAAKFAVPLTGSETISLAEGAAWTAAARVLINLDEFITRE